MENCYVVPKIGKKPFKSPRQKLVLNQADKYGTPTDLMLALQEEFKFDHDPCPIDWHPDTHPDALAIEWGRSVYLNPPYSNAGEFVAKAHAEWRKGGKTIVILLNAVTDTKYFHKYIYNQAELRFLLGRLKFINQSRPELLIHATNVSEGRYTYVLPSYSYVLG